MCKEEKTLYKSLLVREGLREGSAPPEKRKQTAKTKKVWRSATLKLVTGLVLLSIGELIVEEYSGSLPRGDDHVAPALQQEPLFPPNQRKPHALKHLHITPWAACSTCHLLEYFSAMQARLLAILKSLININTNRGWNIPSGFYSLFWSSCLFLAYIRNIILPDVWIIFRQATKPKHLIKPLRLEIYLKAIRVLVLTRVTTQP